MARLIRMTTRSWVLVSEHKRAYIILNILYYGLILVFMGVAAMNPGMQNDLLRSARESVDGGPLAIVGQAYGNGRVLQAIGLTLLMNLIIGSFVFMTLPSMIIPFIGIFAGMYRAAFWGLLFYPGHPEMGVAVIPHVVTLVLEGQAYVLVMLAAWLSGRAFVFPKKVGASGHWHGYVVGLKQTAKVYWLVVLLLLVAAVYEAIEVIWIVNRIRG